MWRLGIGGALVVLAACGGATSLPTTSPRPTLARHTPPPTGLTTRTIPAHPAVSSDRPPALVVKVTGNSPASSITFDIDNRSHRRTGLIRLPSILVDRNLDDIDGAYPVTVQVRAYARATGTRIACKIVESGTTVDSVAATGPLAVVFCSDHQPEDPLTTAGDG